MSIHRTMGNFGWLELPQGRSGGVTGGAQGFTQKIDVNPPRGAPRFCFGIFFGVHPYPISRDLFQCFDIDKYFEVY
eukprot:scaffold191192_cov33-Prasinocladus_malaysianus.AAC.1